MKFKRNKYLILAFAITLIITIIPVCIEYYEYFSYAKAYYVTKENCYEGKNPDHEYCDVFKKYGQEYLEYYIESSNPHNEAHQKNAITLTCTIVETSIFSILQFLSPLIILIAFVGTVHPLFSSGMFKNYLLRTDYKSFMKKIYKEMFKASLITPIALILLFIICTLTTNFNFHIPEGFNGAVYEPWKYSNFLLYGTFICLIQFLINFLYCNIGLYCCKKNKNTLVTILMSYVLFIIVDLFIYLGVYVVLINKILGFRNLTEYFNITGYWFFNFGPSCLYIIIIAFILQILSTFIVMLFYQRKEKVVIECEKQTA